MLPAGRLAVMQALTKRGCATEVQGCRHSALCNQHKQACTCAGEGVGGALTPFRRRSCTSPSEGHDCTPAAPAPLSGWVWLSTVGASLGCRARKNQLSALQAACSQRAACPHTLPQAGFVGTEGSKVGFGGGSACTATSVSAGCLAERALTKTRRTGAHLGRRGGQIGIPRVCRL